MANSSKNIKITFPYFSPFGGFLQKTKKLPLFLTENPQHCEPIDFFENRSNRPLGPQLWFTFYAKSDPIDSFRVKIRKNQKWVIFWPIFAFFDVFAHFLSRIWTTLVGHHFFWILRSIRIQNCLRIFSSSNSLSATAAQTMVILHIFSHFCKFWHFFGNFFNVLRIFSAVSWWIFTRIFLCWKMRFLRF